MPSVIAIVAHPDDIEFLMAGTLILLKQQGWEIHYFNISNGCCGSMEMDREETAKTRLEESKEAAARLGAIFHPPVCDDMAIYYEPNTLAHVASVVRKANPQIVLTHAPSDYMEDHQNACRLAVSATFVKNMPNFLASCDTQPGNGHVAVYHGQPHSNFDPLGRRIHPTHLVDIQSVFEEKKSILACHRSQFGWLDSTQGMASMDDTLLQLNRDVGGQGSTGIYEGFRRHNPTGFSNREFDPLGEALGTAVQINLSDFMQ